MESRVLSHRTQWLLMMGLTLGVIAVLLIGAEGAFRLRQYLRYGSAQTVDDLYTLDEKTGLRIPKTGVHLGGRLTVNQLGFRGPEIVTPKPTNTVRLAFIGASTTWCGEVSSDQMTWPHLVTAALRSAFPGRSFDYVNAGVPGYTMQSALKNLLYRVAPLQPDIIVIYEATNDLSGEMRDLALSEGLIRNTKWLTEQSWLARHSLLWNVSEKNFRLLVAQQAARENSGRLKFDANRIGREFRKAVQSVVYSSKSGAQVVGIATFSVQLREGQSMERQLKAASSALYYMPFMSPASLIAAYAQYNQIIRGVAKETGVLLIDGEDSIPGDQEYFVDTVHFTDLGSQRMADRVSRALIADERVRRLVYRVRKGSLSSEHFQPDYAGKVSDIR